MMQKLLGFVKKPTSKHVLVNIVGNYLNVFFTALFALIMVRVMSAEQYGILSVLFGISYVLANFLDFGTTATIYSYFPPLYEKKSAATYRFIKSTFFYQTLFSLIVIAVLFVIFPYLDQIFFKTGAAAWELYLTAISVLFFIWQNFALNILFAAKKFFKANLCLNVSNLVKTLIIFLLIPAKMISVGSVIFVFGILGPVFFFLLLFIGKKDLVFILLKSKVKKEEFRFGYTLTYFAASQFLNMGLRMDLFLLSYFRSKAEVGYYGLAQKIILSIITTVISITQVLSPSFSKITKKSQAKSQFKTGFLYLLVPALLFLLVFLTPNSLFNLFFTDKFEKTAAISKSLSLPFIFYCLSNLPTLFLLYGVKKPGYILFANVVFFLILTVGSYILIPIKGVFGPPLAIFLALLIQALIQSLAAVREYGKLRA